MQLGCVQSDTPSGMTRSSAISFMTTAFQAPPERRRKTLQEANLLEGPLMLITVSYTHLTLPTSSPV